MQSLKFIDWETVEQLVVPVHNDHGAVEGYTPEPWLEEDFAKAVDYVLSNPDAASCAMRGLDTAVPLCMAPVGWVLHEPDPPESMGGLEWRPTVLVRTESGVVAVCEECSPASLYREALESVTTKQA